MRGHLVKRSEDSWTIILDTGRDPATGKRRQQWQTVRGTKKEAERVLAEVLHQLDTGAFVKPGKLTLGDFLRQWFRDYALTHVRPTTLRGYRTIIEGRLVPSLGNIPLSELKPAHLQAYYSRTLTEPRQDNRPGTLSARTVLGHHRVLKEALGHAVKWGLVGRNIADAVSPPRPRKTEVKALDSEGVGRLLKAAEGTQWYPVIHLAVHTGLRRSELLGLRWKDVDLDMATLSVVQVMHPLPGGKVIILEPKTSKGKRQVALTPASALALRAYQEKQEADRALLGLPFSEDALVFSRADGSPTLPNSLSHAFIGIMRRAGLQGIRFHDLRHTHATLMLKQEVHPKVVSERLGHATIVITLDTYSHVLPGLQEDAARRFDEVLAAKPC